MRPGHVLICVVVFLLISAVAPREARGDAVASAPGTYASVVSERSVLVWDEAARLEHLVRRITFDADAGDIGYLVPTPAPAELAEVLGDPAGAVDATSPQAPPAARAKDHGEAAVLHTFEHASFGAAEGSQLDAWLAAHGYAEPAGMRAWAAMYLRKGWVVQALRFAGAPGEGRRLLVAPVVRFSFAADAPFYPYTEPERDIEAEAAFLHRYHSSRAARDVGVWIVAPTEVHAVGNFLQGLPEERAWETSAAKLSLSLGDTSAWRLDVRGRASWTVSYLHESLEQRVAFEDLRFAPHEELAKAKPAPRRSHTTEWLFALLALGLGAAVALAVRAA